MRGQVIGKTMPHGYAGSYSRQPDSVIDSHPLAGTAAVPFGLAVVRDTTNKHAVVLPGATATAAQILGVAVREVKTTTDYLNQNMGQYNPGDAVSVLKRGCVNVKCQNGTPAPGGDVYVRIATNEGVDGAVVGGFEAAADSTYSVKLTNAQWKTEADENGIAEVRFMTIINA